MSGIQRILVPTDFSPTSDIAVTYAIDLAQRLAAEIHFLHVIDDAIFAAAESDGVYVELPDLRERKIKDATAELQKPVTRGSAAGLMITGEVIVGNPARVIAQTAASRGADLIVMGTHGRGAFAHFVLGSVAERMVRIAPCAVLTVRDTSHTADAIAAERVSHRAAAIAG